MLTFSGRPPDCVAFFPLNLKAPEEIFLRDELWEALTVKFPGNSSQRSWLEFGKTDFVLRAYGLRSEDECWGGQWLTS